VCPYKTAIVGAGNLLMADEGIGVRVVQALDRELLPNGVALFDAGTAFQALIGELAGFDKWIIVDAVNGGGRPGEIYRLEWAQLLEGFRGCGSIQDHSPVSLHDLGVIETLMLERLVDRAFPASRFSRATEVVVLGIEPERIELSLELSPTVECQLPALLEAVRDELERTQNPSPRREGVSFCNEEERS
jgi:hydrogenase maturation protease